MRSTAAKLFEYFFGEEEPKREAVPTTDKTIHELTMWVGDVAVVRDEGPNFITNQLMEDYDASAAICRDHGSLCIQLNMQNSISTDDLTGFFDWLAKADEKEWKVSGKLIRDGYWSEPGKGSDLDKFEVAKELSKAINEHRKQKV